ncbi:MAG: ecfE [Burkholderiaceae bacterium]|nr:ecfE [Burkholderiaceae bacterium]
MIIIQTALAFLLATCLLVVVHELGHYLVARLCDVKVLRFSLGVGKVLYSRRFGKDQTEWAISLLPIGGYVMMLDARDQDLSELPPEELKREFHSQNVWKRFAIVLAGPASNFLLGIMFMAGIYLHGIQEPAPKLRAVQENTIVWQAGLRGGELVTAVNGQPVRIWSEMRWKMLKSVIDGEPIRLDVQDASAGSLTPAMTRSVTIPIDGLTVTDIDKNFSRVLGIELARPKAQIGPVAPDGAAMKAGLREGDVVLAVNGQSMLDSLAFVELVRASPDKTLSLTILRGQERLELPLTPVAYKEKDAQIGKIMADVQLRPEMIFAQDSLPQAVVRGVSRTWETISVSFRMIGRMVLGEVSLKSISGPLTIADYAGQTARIGLVSYLGFLAFISISIGVMNLLPIPVLDGGLLLYYSMEILTGRTISERAGNIAQRIGLGLLMTMMVIALINDIVRLVF